MTTFTKNHGDIFYPALAAVAMIAPLLLVSMAGALPEGTARGDLLVSGHAIILAILASGLVLRAAYALGFTRAFNIVAAERRHSAAA